MIIGICDDEIIIRNELIRLCGIVKETSIITLEIKCFSSGEQLLECQEPIDILFLDIQMKGMDGLHTAMKIREQDDSMIIIFLTGYRDYLQEGYRVKAFRYLLKPIKEVEFLQALTDAMNEITKNYKAILGMDGETLYIKLKDIIYIEYVNRVTVVRTRKCTYQSGLTISEWETVLSIGDFYRVHKAYIVNMAYIEEIGKKVLMDNGEKVEVAVRQMGKLKKACKEFRRRNAR